MTTTIPILLALESGLSDIPGWWILIASLGAIIFYGFIKPNRF